MKLKHAGIRVCKNTASASVATFALDGKKEKISHARSEFYKVIRVPLKSWEVRKQSKSDVRPCNTSDAEVSVRGNAPGPCGGFSRRETDVKLKKKKKNVGRVEGSPPPEHSTKHCLSSLSSQIKEAAHGEQRPLYHLNGTCVQHTTGQSRGWAVHQWTWLLLFFF